MSENNENKKNRTWVGWSGGPGLGVLRKAAARGVYDRTAYNQRVVVAPLPEGAPEYLLPGTKVSIIGTDYRGTVVGLPTRMATGGPWLIPVQYATSATSEPYGRIDVFMPSNLKVWTESYRALFEGDADEIKAKLASVGLTAKLERADG